jgi:hypothetical protein
LVGDAGFDPREGRSEWSGIRERWRQASVGSGGSVSLGHEIDMMDNHYKTSMFEK